MIHFLCLHLLFQIVLNILLQHKFLKNNLFDKYNVYITCGLLVTNSCIIGKKVIILKLF